MARTASTNTTSLKASSSTNEMIRKKAYELYEKRGKKPGHSLDDWLEAERIVRQKKF